jgi:hypothetical protein
MLDDDDDDEEEGESFLNVGTLDEDDGNEEGEVELPVDDGNDTGFIFGTVEILFEGTALVKFVVLLGNVSIGCCCWTDGYCDGRNGKTTAKGCAPVFGCRGGRIIDAIGAVSREVDEMFSRDNSDDEGYGCI